jgi:hypothetical protein
MATPVETARPRDSGWRSFWSRILVFLVVGTGSYLLFFDPSKEPIFDGLSTDPVQRMWHWGNHFHQRLPPGTSEKEIADALVGSHFTVNQTSDGRIIASRGVLRLPLFCTDRYLVEWRIGQEPPEVRAHTYSDCPR